MSSTPSGDAPDASDTHAAPAVDEEASLLEVEGLHTAFHTDRGTVTAVDGVDLALESGEIVGLVGESGSGKSVLARSIMGLVDDPGEIVGGDVRIRGESLVDADENRLNELRGSTVSLVFQDPMHSLNPTLSVGEQIAETVRLNQDVGESVSLSAEMKRKILGAAENSEAWRRAIEMLEAVQIPEPAARAGDFPHEFSGGMRQRAMLAIALSCEPDLLIADEPTTALDVTIQAQILDELRDLKEEFDTTILLITHNLAVVAETCDRVNVMYAGEIVERAPTETLFDAPSHPYTQGLIASTPRVDDPEADLQPIPGSVPEGVGDQPPCKFAPRCPEAKAECYEQDPYFRDVGEDHEAACLRRGPEGERL